MNRLATPTDLLSRHRAEPAPQPADAPSGGTLNAAVYRLRLVIAVAATVAAVLALVSAVAPPPSQSPELLRLLRGMVLIKGTIALAAGALVWWRLGRPIEATHATRYTAALCLAAGALAWLWGLHLVSLGSLLFYGGLGGLYLAGRSDRLLGLGFTARRSR